LIVQFDVEITAGFGAEDSKKVIDVAFDEQRL
jgi:hypothetical protein